MSTTHVAGPVIGFRSEDRMIQRCALCGEKLIDCHPSRMAVPDGCDRGVPQFKQGNLIEVIDGNPTAYMDRGAFETEPLPDNFCLSLVEE